MIATFDLDISALALDMTNAASSYRHRDLLEKIHALAAEPPTTSERATPAVIRASLQADLLAAHERAARLHTRVQHLERRLSNAHGEHTWRESGLGAPADIDTLHQQITRFEQQVIDPGLQLAERDEDLAAARTTPVALANVPVISV